MHKVVYPDYDNSILNVANSLLAYYGCPNKYSGIRELDEKLAKKYKHIAVFLIDAMGTKIIDRHCRPDSFFHTHMLKSMTTVCPSTTSSATTAFLSGLSPLETGWFGWQQYFEKYNRHIILFKNEDYYSGDQLTTNILKNDLPYMNLFDQIRLVNPDVKSYTTIFEDDKKKFLSLHELVRLVKRNFQKDEISFTYAYYTKLDSLMHEVGPNHKKLGRLLRRIERRIARLTKKMKDDSLVIVIADHGQIEVEEYNVFEHKELLKTITGKPGIEGRFATFNVVDEAGFKKYHKNNLTEYFDIYTKEEILAKHFFGPGDATKFENFFGNYFLVAKDKYLITYHETPQEMHVGHHAGLTEDEMLIPLIVS
ncbi:MAG: alkaline phosphatase family protein [Bacilli bacterium]|jgi:predicted AlkP superfamily pyrophosphatase or phosphodiesterase